MAEEEEDYMSDSLLLGTPDIRPGLIFNRTQKRTHELSKKKEKMKKKKTYAEKEKETREIGLKTPLTKENKGFQMLMKMGFQPGQKIGANADASDSLKEPVEVITKDSKTGLGHDSEVAERKQKIIQKKKEDNQELFSEFRANTLQKKTEQLLINDFERAQRTCENMDYQNSVPEPICPWYWPEKKQEKEESEEDSNKEEVEDQEEELVDKKDVKNLHCILNYLRNTYSYCMYCLITFQNNDDMLQNCPGVSRDDHNDD